jgi:hypothetical protein
VLNLAGLWGGARSARNWVNRVAPTKDALRLKVSAVAGRCPLPTPPHYRPDSGYQIPYFRSQEFPLLNLQGSIHLIHGLDVSRAILAVHANFDKAQGQRWILSDGRVYDWWDLASAWGIPNRKSPTDSVAPAGASRSAPERDEKNAEEEEDGERGPHPRWVRDLMEETGVRALPRNVELLGRAMDSREFGTTFGLSHVKARLD